MSNDFQNPPQMPEGYTSQFQQPTTLVMPYASWGIRVAAYLVDAVVAIPASILLLMGFNYSAYQNAITDLSENRTPDFSNVIQPIFWVGLFLGLLIFIWNQCYLQGKTGQTVGKKVLGLKLLNEQTLLPIGFGMSLIRQFLHQIAAIPCYLGYLWPLFDAKRQTLADKILNSIVITVDKTAK